MTKMDQGAGIKLADNTQTPTPNVLTVKPIKMALTIRGNFVQIRPIEVVGSDTLFCSNIFLNLNDEQISVV